MSFQKEGKLACRYFTILPEWLENHGKQVYRLPWLFNVNIPLKEVYARLRSSNCLIPEDWLTLRDYIWSFYQGIKTIFTIRDDLPFDGMNIRSLLQRERCIQWNSGLSTSLFWRYWRMLCRWTASLEEIIFIEHYENMPPEHVQAFWAHTHGIKKFKVIGYYHSIVSREFIAYHLPPGEEKSKIFPDLIITNGSLGKKILVEQGYPEDKIREGPALRQLFPQSKTNEERKNTLLILLSMLPEHAAEHLDKILKLYEWLQREKISVFVKKHPMMKKDFLLSLMNWEHLQEGWKWHDGEIYDALSQSKCTTILATAGGIDALLSGCLVVPLLPEFGNAMNSVDVLEKEFPILCPVSQEQIKSRLEEIFITREEFYRTEIKRICNKLIDMLNPVCNDTLSVFLSCCREK